MKLSKKGEYALRALIDLGIAAEVGRSLVQVSELAEKEKIPASAASDTAAATQFVNRLHEAGLLTVPAGAQIVRLLPALNLTHAEAEQGLQIIGSVAAKLTI